MVSLNKNNDDEKIELEMGSKDENEELIYSNAPERQNFIGRVLKRRLSWEKMPDRKIRPKLQDKDLQNNSISTSKYTLINFLPKNLFEQFSKLPNDYFLLIGFLQMIKEISTSKGVPVNFGPLSVILLIIAIKDFSEDLKRHNSDKEENNRKILALREDKFEEICWKDILVGDVIKIKKDQYFPADIVLVKSSESKGVCFIETKNMDGETNLKHKKVSKDFEFTQKEQDELVFFILFLF